MTNWNRWCVWAVLGLALGGCSDSNEAFEPNCGNGQLDSGEACDGESFAEGKRACAEGEGFVDGKSESDITCSATCTVVTTGVCEKKADEEKCGNGTLDSGEACDGESFAEGKRACAEGEGFVDGKSESDITCSATCTVVTTGVCEKKADEEKCGNGQLDSGEECDDGNTVDNDMCSNACKVNGYDAYVPQIAPNTGVLATCGNRIHEAGETCEPGEPITIDGVERICTDKCLVPAVEGKGNCGTGTLEDGEECDDGNTADGDGCSRSCKLEKGTCQVKNGAVVQMYLAQDGDTFKFKVIKDGTDCSPSKSLTMRLHGIDTPECVKKETVSPMDSSYKAYSCDPDMADQDNPEKPGSGELGGAAARDFVNSLVFSEENKGLAILECETRSDADPLCVIDATNDRYLAYVKVLKDGRYVDLAKETVRAGYAMTYTDFTSIHLEEYCAAEKEAIAAKVGVWSHGTSFTAVVNEYFQNKAYWLLNGHCE